MILKSKLSPIDGIIRDKKIFRVRLVMALIAESLDFKIFEPKFHRNFMPYCTFSIAFFIIII